MGKADTESRAAQGLIDQCLRTPVALIACSMLQPVFVANQRRGLHLLCSSANGLIYESDCAAFNPFRDKPVSGGRLLAGGYVEPNDRYGLGVEVDKSLFAKLPRISGPCCI